MKLAIASLIFLSACAGGSKSPGDTDADTDVALGANTVTMTFSVSAGVRGSPSLTDPLVGTVWGSIYLQGDVSVTGPRDGAVDYADIEVHDVDLSTDDVSAQTWTSPELGPELYTFLGMFDVDGTGSDAEAGDPVTLPTTNQFEIVDGQATTMNSKFELIYN